ncbi:hypothetical protein QBC40DRAFT_298047 [Triangularia verruculosa]|uniref:Uncharacterized protein n=1 Tax=Triangularia verruculosa TaxID=2587418 RepID=A0AAN6XI18_9PEZI|nr:hypothetical protein QBC40DRAFT_298047 [Triangularia verruculosa]
MKLFHFALVTIGLLATAVQYGRSFDTGGYLEIAKDIWVWNQTTTLSPQEIRPPNATHCGESQFWDRYGLTDYASLYDDCQRLFDGLTAVQFKNATGPIEWVFSEDSYLVAAISGSCGFFVHAYAHHTFIGIDDIGYMMNATMQDYSGTSYDGHYRVALVEGEVTCDAPAPGSPGQLMCSSIQLRKSVCVASHDLQHAAGAADIHPVYLAAASNAPEATSHVAYLAIRRVYVHLEFPRASTRSITVDKESAW